MDKHKFLISLVITLILCSACQGNPFHEPTYQETGRISSTGNRDLSQETQPQNRSMVTVKAESGKTIHFEAAGQNPVEIPHLVLTRNGELTQPAERSLEIEVNGIEVPPAGVTVTVSLETQHANPEMDAPGERIRVWSESIAITNTTGVPQAGGAVKFQYEFRLTIPSDPKPVLTPTDYYRLVIDLQDAGQPEAEPTHMIDLDYAFLLESQWIAPLPEVLESAPGAAPDTLVVYACDMFMPARSSSDETPGIARRNFTKFVQNKIIPAMVEAFRMQSKDWQLPWYPGWTNYRTEEESDVLSVSLSDGKTWFHGPVSSLGNEGISLTLKKQDLLRQNVIPGRLMKTFHHELFHNIQRSINKYFGKNGDLDGIENAWAFFSEGTAVFAATVGQPEVEFHPEFSGEGYLDRANQFILWDLKAGYGEVNQLSALYWRFLYEKCGAMLDGFEKPAAGMQIISLALEALYSGEIVDIYASGELVQSLPAVMNRALAGSTCPFRTYEESLIAFAHAIYALRLQNGRCTLPGQPTDCELYDPGGFYALPQVSVIHYLGTRLTYPGENEPIVTGDENRHGVVNSQDYANPSNQEKQLSSPAIPHSYGMDYIEVELDPAANGQSLRLELAGVPGSPARFHVEIVPLSEARGVAGTQFTSGQVAFQEIIANPKPGNQVEIVLPTIDTSIVSKLALIITRLDSSEKDDPVGGYSITLVPNP